VFYENGSQTTLHDSLWTLLPVAKGVEEITMVLLPTESLSTRGTGKKLQLSTNNSLYLENEVGA